MEIYSHSKLETYQNCPQQYKIRYIDRARPPQEEKGIEAFLGGIVHDALEKLYKELILSKLNTLDEILGFYKSEWTKNWHDNIVIVKKEFTREHYYQTGIEAITNYYNRHQPFKQSKTLATEQKIRFKIDDYIIEGVIDRLSHNGKGIYEIHDYKTSAYLPTQDKLDNDRQLALYKIGVKEQHKDAKEIFLKWHYLVYDKEFTSKRTDVQLKDLKKEVVSLIKTIEKDKTFNPNESNLCDWCFFTEYCPAKKHEFKLKALPLNKYLEDNGVTLVNKYASIKAKIQELHAEEKRLENELDLIASTAIAYAEREGIANINGSDHILKIAIDTKLSFPKANDDRRDEFERCIKKAGLWEEVSELSLPRLTKLVETGDFDSKIKKQLMRFAEEIKKDKVRLIKKKRENDI